MSNIELKVPDGYFDESLKRTMARTATVRKRRIALLGVFAALLVLGGIYSFHRTSYLNREKDYLAQEAELARLDIFLEIN